MEWTNDEVINLINLFRDRPVLWDCRLEEFKDRNKRMDALLEIAVSLGVEKEEIERKFMNLVCHFSSEVIKEREGIKSGAGIDKVYKSKWFCYDSMLFLKDRNRSRGTTDTQIQAQSVQSGVQKQTESILPDVASMPNLDIVKKKPLDYAEESVTSPAQNTSSSSGCMLSLKSEPSDDCVDGSTVPVTPNDTSLPTTSTSSIESSSTSMFYACTDNAEPPAKRPNISQNPFTSNTETKDVFSVFADFVAAKLRNFTDRRLQVEAQHRITNMLFEMEMEDLNGDSLPVISKISS